MIICILLQVYSGLCALLGVGQATAKDASKFDKVFGFVICLVYLAFILVIERLK